MDAFPRNIATDSLMHFGGDVAEFLLVNDIAREQFIQHTLQSHNSPEVLSAITAEQEFDASHKIMDALQTVIKTRDAIDILYPAPFNPFLHLHYMSLDTDGMTTEMDDNEE